LFSSGVAREGSPATIMLGGVKVTLATKAHFLAVLPDGGRPQLIRLHRYRLGRRIGGVPCAERVLCYCPCGHRTSALFLHEGRFVCRPCTKLHHLSDNLRRDERLLARMDRLAKLVGGDGVGIMFPPRPKHMRKAYYRRLESEFRQLDEEWNKAAWKHLFGDRSRRKQGSALEP
jgi:hypothetical protein